MSITLDPDRPGLFAASGSSTLVVSFERVEPVISVPLPTVPGLGIGALPTLPTLPTLPVERPEPLPIGRPEGLPQSDQPVTALERVPLPERWEVLKTADRGVRPEQLQLPDRPVITLRTDAARGENAPTLEQALDKLVQRLDTNDNGNVSLGEITELLGPLGKNIVVKTVLGRMFDHLDTDDSGGLTATELATLLRSRDADGDGRIERGEMPAINAGDVVALIGLLLLPATPFGGG